LSASLGGAQFDSRTWRMARSARAAGYDVVIYARWFEGLALEDRLDGHRVIRVPIDPTMALPVLRRLGRRRIERLRARERAAMRGAKPQVATTASPEASPTPGRALGSRGLSVMGLGRLLFIRAIAMLPRWLRAPMMWAAWRNALRDVVEPADIWHGMWMTSLPAAVSLRSAMGGTAIYDSRDIVFESRDWPRAGRLPRTWLLRLEKRLARACDVVLTVNEAYADFLTRSLAIPRPRIVMNCPELYTPPSPPPNLIRNRLALPAQVGVVLYQGALFTERGIEESMDAILDVDDACLVLMGYGDLRVELVRRVSSPPYRGRVFVIDPVPPSELLQWTSSADVMLIAIAPTTLNHRYSTPQKLFEAMAAGVPVVATDLPGMADIVRATGCGVLCESVAPEPIAAAVRSILELPEEERQALRQRCLRAAHERYNWESQVGTLLEVYETLAARRPANGHAIGSAVANTADSRHERR
jgi:glycosyltransferase involved in cell wall biosynthesis